MKNEQLKAAEWLSATYPSEIELLGLESTKDILDACWAGESFREDRRLHGGRTMDTVEVVKLVFAAATFIKTSLDIWKHFKERGKKPTEEELKDGLKKRIPLKSWPSDHERLIQLIASEDGWQLGGA